MLSSGLMPLLAFLLSFLANDPLDDARALLHRAQSQYTEAQYAGAVAALTQILARHDLPAAMRREATLYLGMSHLALGHDEDARTRFREVLEADDAYELPRDTSPKVRGLFEQVREKVQATPVLAALPPVVQSAAAGPDHVRFRFRADRVGARETTAYWRRRGQSDWSRAILKWSAAVDGSPELTTEPPLGASAEAAGPGIDFDLQYYAEVREGGRVLARAGTAEQPLEIRVHVHGPSAREHLNSGSNLEQPFYKRWWFWTLAGVAAAGTVTVVYLGTHNDVTTGSLDIHFMVGQ
jgi:hypothetical protein